MAQDSISSLLTRLDRIAALLERNASDSLTPIPKNANALVWHADSNEFTAVEHINALPLPLLKGIDDHQATLLENTRRFAKGLPANNALLWGARGTGKSSLVKAVHQALTNSKNKLTLVEIHREDISHLPRLLTRLRHEPTRKFLLLCDDLSFDAQDTSYKSLKSVLDGGIEGRPENVLFYATSNRRHLMPREIGENDAAIHAGENVEEKVSLSDRFGLWLGFHHLDQATYLAIIKGYTEYFKLKIPAKQLEAEALEWSTTRGARSGRVAWQFIVELAGRSGKTLSIAK